MKRNLLCIFLFITGFTTVNAQTEKGTWLLGGTGNFSSIKQGDDKVNVFSIAPDMGYFIINDLAIGAGIEFQSLTYKYKDEEDDKISSVSFNPFIRYYFLSLGSNTKLFGNGSFGFGSVKAYGESESFSQWEISAGPAIFLNKSVALEIALGYGSTKFKEEDDAANTFGLNVGFQIHF